MDFSIRTEMLLGAEALERLKSARVAVFGLGGVGSYVAAALARCGVGELLLVDRDVISPSNINRQLFAVRSTVGMTKCGAAAKYISDISENISVKLFPIDYCDETADDVPFSGCDFVADCVDTVSAKLLIIEKAKAASVPVISCMGTGNKLYPERFRVTDIAKTSVCPLARVMRYELKKRGITGVSAVWSDELPRKPIFIPEGEPDRTPASISFVPSAAGLVTAGEIIRKITGNE